MIFEEAYRYGLIPLGVVLLVFVAVANYLTAPAVSP